MHDSYQNESDLAAILDSGVFEENHTIEAKRENPRTTRQTQSWVAISPVSRSTAA